ncbi:MAG: DUF547 domain-containing protein, partial [Bacteroidota bacterium]
MKKLFGFIIAIIAFSASVNAQKIDATFFNQADAFFKAQVKNGLVDYSTLKSNAQLRTLIQQIENADLSTADTDTKKAFYINAYNLLVINA